MKNRHLYFALLAPAASIALLSACGEGNPFNLEDSYEWRQIQVAVENVVDNQIPGCFKDTNNCPEGGITVPEPPPPPPPPTSSSSADDPEPGPVQSSSSVEPSGSVESSSSVEPSSSSVEPSSSSVSLSSSSVMPSSSSVATSSSSIAPSSSSVAPPPPPPSSSSIASSSSVAPPPPPPPSSSSSEQSSGGNSCGYKNDANLCPGVAITSVKAENINKADDANINDGDRCYFATTITQLANISGNFTINGKTVAKCGRPGWGQPTCAEALSTAGVTTVDEGYYIYTPDNYKAGFVISNSYAPNLHPNCR